MRAPEAPFPDTRPGDKERPCRPRMQQHAMRGAGATEGEVAGFQNAAGGSAALGRQHLGILAGKQHAEIDPG